MRHQWRHFLPRGTAANTAVLARSLSSEKSPKLSAMTRNIALVAWTALCGVLGAKFALHDSGEQEAPGASAPPQKRGSKNGSSGNVAGSNSGDSLLDSGPPQPPLPRNVYDAAIVGGGVVGLAVARELAVSFPNQRFILLEKSPDLVAGASSGNSGLGCTGYDAPSGSLERQLLRRSAQRHPNLYRSLGLSFEHARKCGALVVAWDKEQLAKLPEVHAANHDAGDTECRILTAAQLLELEPALGGPNKKVLPLGGVLVPREVISEPWIVPIAYAESARLNGCAIRPGAELVALTVMRNSDARAIRAVEAQRSGNKDAVAAISAADADDSNDDWFWTLTVQEKRDGGNQVLETVGARVVINCAGLFGDEVEAMRSEAAVYAARGGKLSVDQATAVAAAGESTQNSLSGHQHRYFNIRPRKGQFVVFDAPSSHDSPVLQHIIEPVPSQFTKGVIVWTTLYGQVVVGPTAEEQDSRTDRQNTPEVIEALKEHGRVVLGDEFLDSARVAGTYSGIRPATEHRDYQVSALLNANATDIARPLSRVAHGASVFLFVC